jgi:hypothetical protein
VKIAKRVLAVGAAVAAMAAMAAPAGAAKPDGFYYRCDFGYGPIVVAIAFLDHPVGVAQVFENCRNRNATPRGIQPFFE